MAAKKKRGRKKKSRAKSPGRTGSSKISPARPTVRPPVQGAPLGIERGTEAYRAWEMSRILSMWALGMSKAQIVTHLAMTPREWRNRVAAIRVETMPGDAVMAWARFIGSSRERMQQFMALYIDARKAGHYASAVGAARSMADLDAKILDMSIRLGLLDPAKPDSGGAQAALSPYAKELEGILMWADPGADLSNMTEEDLQRANARLHDEYLALRNRPTPPSLLPEN